MNRSVFVSLLALLLGASSAQSQKSASISTANACIQDSVFSFDIVFHPDAGWNDVYESGIGNSSWFLDFTKERLSAPQIDYVSPHADPLYGYQNCVALFGNKIGITTTLDPFSVGGVHVNPDSAFILYSLSLTIVQAEGLEVTWDEANTGIFDSRDRYVLETLSNYDSLLTTSVAHNDDIAIPGHYQLYQNFPNPFNPSTTFEYQMPAAGPVELNIYNLLGRRISTLVDGIKPAGKYRLAWDGTDSRGRTVPAGIYLLKMNAGEYTKVIRMVLVK